MTPKLTPFSTILSHYQKHDPLIASLLPNINFADWFEAESSSDHFYNLARNIIYQQLAGKAASTIFGRFEKLVGAVTPSQVQAVADQQMRDAGLSWAKVRYVKDLADKVITGEVVLTDLAERENEAVISELTKVKGIGRWTAEMFLLFTLHRENIFSYGDLGLKNGFSLLYGVTDPTPASLQAVVKNWAPYESYGSIALWHALDNR